MKFKISIFLLLLVFVSCKSKQSLSKTESSKGLQIDQLIEHVQKNQPNFKTANVSKMSLALNMNNRELNVSATCKVTKDSMIQLSIQPFLGIEMFKADLTPTNILVIDKMNRRYFEVDYSFFSTKFGVDVDFNSLQSLIFAQFFCVGTKVPAIDKCKLNVQTNGTKMIVYETAKMQQNTVLTALNVIQQVILSANNSDYKLQTDYSDYTIFQGVSFPQKIALKATNSKTEAAFDFSILKVEFDKPLKYTSSATDKYSKAEIEQLISK